MKGRWEGQIQEQTSGMCLMSAPSVLVSLCQSSWETEGSPWPTGPGTSLGLPFHHPFAVSGTPRTHTYPTIPALGRALSHLSTPIDNSTFPLFPRVSTHARLHSAMSLLHFGFSWQHRVVRVGASESSHLGHSPPSLNLPVTPAPNL